MASTREVRIEKADGGTFAVVTTTDPEAKKTIVHREPMDETRVLNQLLGLMNQKKELQQQIDALDQEIAIWRDIQKQMMG